ncbi:MAG: hypothetical protein QXX20_04025 [Candidatus Thermoplasmatota archaeon]
MTWMRWYYPSLWFFSFMMFIGLQLLNLLGLFCILTGSLHFGILFLLPIFFQCIYGYAGFKMILKSMQYPKPQFKSALIPTLLTPVVFVLITINMAVSSIKNTITWCGKTYTKKEFFKRPDSITRT